MLPVIRSVIDTGEYCIGTSSLDRNSRNYKKTPSKNGQVTNICRDDMTMKEDSKYTCLCGDHELKLQTDQDSTVKVTS